MRNCPYCNEETERRLWRTQSHTNGWWVWRCQNHDCEVSAVGWVSENKSEQELSEYLPLAIDYAAAVSWGRGETPRLVAARAALANHWSQWGRLDKGLVR